MKLKELITDIEKSPSKYLVRPSITRLSAFLDGYILGNQTEDLYLGDFQNWVSLKDGIKSAHKWSEIILFFEQGEEKALARFFELFKEFLVNGK